MRKTRRINYSIFLVLLCLSLIDFFVKSNIYSSITLGDITFVLLIINWFIGMKGKIKLNKVTLVTVMYFMYFTLQSSILILISDKLNILTFLYITKELIYISVYFIVIYSFDFNKKSSKSIVSFFIIITLIYGFYSLATRNITYYGISAIVSNSPSQSGIIFLMCAIISMIFYINTKEKVYFILIIVSILTTIATISRTAIVGLAIFLASFFSLSLTRKMLTKFEAKKFYKFITLLLLISSVIYILLRFDLFNFTSLYLDKMIDRFMNLSRSVEVRQNMSSDYFSSIIGDSGIKLIFGQGKAIPEIFFNRTTLGVDNQYTRFIIEGGLIGIIIWVIMITTWIISIKKNLTMSLKNILYSIIVMYFFIGFGYEFYQVSKSGISIWLILGILHATSIHFSRENL